MYIFGRLNDGSVSLLSKYEHITSCDPVVVQDDIAYVTLRNGVECNGFTNQLEIIDVSNLKKPEVLGIFQMENPHGLGIDQTCLFITEGEFGMKVYNAQVDKKQIKMDLLKNYRDIHAFDVIPFNNVLMMIGNDGLYQFEYNCSTGDMSLLSTLSIQPL